VDGATGLRRFLHVTFPLLANMYLVLTLLATIFLLGDFNSVYFVTGGGPANSTMVLSMFTYLMSFVRFDFGLGAASSWLMLLMALLLCLFFIALIRRREVT